MGVIREANLQRAIMARLREARLLLGPGVFEAWHIPNEGNRGIGGQAEAIRQGLTPGAPDIIVLLPGGRCFSVELKRPKSGGRARVSNEQKNIKISLDALGHEYYTIWPETVEAGVAEMVQLMREHGVPMP